MKKALKFLLVGLIAFSQVAYPIEVYAEVVDEAVVENNEISNTETNQNKDNNIIEDNNIEKTEEEIASFSQVGINDTNLYTDNQIYKFNISSALEEEKVTINLTSTEESSIIDENKYILKATLSFNQILNDQIIDTKEETKTILLTGLELKNYNIDFNNIGANINGKYQLDISLYNTEEDLIETDEESLNEYINNKEAIYSDKLVDFYTNNIETKLDLITNLECTDKTCNLDVNASDKVVTFEPKVTQGDTSIDLDGTYFTYKVNDEIVLNDYIFNNQLDFNLLLKGTYKVTVSLVDKNSQEILTDSINIIYGNSIDNTNLEEYYNISSDMNEQTLLAKLISTTVVDDNIINNLIDVELLKDIVYKEPIDKIITNNLTDKLGYKALASSFLDLNNDGNYYSVITAENFKAKLKDTDVLPTVKEIKEYLKDTNLNIKIVDKNGKEVADNAYISTNMQLIVSTNPYTLSYTFLIGGDLDDGLANDNEVKKMIDVALGLDNFDILNTAVVDYNHDNIIDIYDISYMAGSIGMKKWLEQTTATDNIKATLSTNTSNIRVNDTFKVTLNLTGFSKDYINGIEGMLNYDKTALELIGLSTQNSLNQYGNFNYNTSTFIQAGEEVVNKDTTVITFTFKALKQTDTNISLSNLKAAKDGSKVNINSSGALSLKINRKLSTNNDIINLKPSTGRLDKEFNKDIYEYNLYVDYRTTSITLEGLLGDKYATTTGFREYKLTDDKTVILIEVVSETGEVKTYKINVIKEYPSTNTSTKQMSLSSNNYLQTLKIEGYEIEFDKDKLEYEITVGSDVTSLDITAIAQLSSANVRIYGNDNFKEGENIVTIVVTAEDGSEKTYTIKVNKESAKKVDADDNDDQTEEDNGNVEKTIIIILIILVVIGLLYLIFKKDDDTPKTNKEQNK